MKPENYLSDEALGKISFAMSDKEDDVDKYAFMLTDGTFIMVEKMVLPSNETNIEGFISNPSNINIVDTCNATIIYNSSDGEEKTVKFVVKSFEDLETQWSGFKSAVGLSEDTIGILDHISLTKDQKIRNAKLENTVNDLLNMFLDTDIDINIDEDYKMPFEEYATYASRYSLINLVLVNTARNLIKLGIADQIHAPYFTKNEEDEITEIREYIDEDSFDNWG